MRKKAARNMYEQPSARIRPHRESRHDKHNSNVDDHTAVATGCRTGGLRTGRVCWLPALHRGGCEFGPTNDLAAKPE